MAESSTTTETRRNQVLVGDLPAEFLRVTDDAPPVGGSQVDQDAHFARQLAAQEAVNVQRTVTTDRLIISIMEAKLKKNYGFMKMDPYCRVRVNHGVYETETANGGSKNPSWHKSISIPVHEPVDNIYIEIFDERSLSSDNKIAWTQITLPEAVKNGGQVDDWWPLSGNLGRDNEGNIHVVISKKKVTQTLPSFPPPFIAPQAYPPVVAMPPGGAYAFPGAYPAAAAAQPRPQTAVAPQRPPITDADVTQIKAMFPDTDKEVIKAVLEASGGNKDAAINSLLSMQ